MTRDPGSQVAVFYSLQSDYCYFLLDRLIQLSETGAQVIIRPVLGGVLRLPDRFADRGALEQRYFQTDTAREAKRLGLPYAYPDPSPIQFKPDSLWQAEVAQPLNERLNRLFVGAAAAGGGLAFLTHVGRMLWDGSTRGWNKGDHLSRTMHAAGFDMDDVLNATPWVKARAVLAENAAQMLECGHWGVPLMVYRSEPFYGQDRFDTLLWRMKQEVE